MSKIVRLDPIGTQVEIQTQDNLLVALLKNDLHVLQECGGRGMCSTCHVYIKEGMDGLSPLNRREIRTLEVVTTSNRYSRLACQARVLGSGVVVEVPSGMYLHQVQDNLEELIGTRAQENILHPITSIVLVETGKLITRSVINQLKSTQLSVIDYFRQNQED